MSDVFIEPEASMRVHHDHGLQPGENGEVTMQMAAFIAQVFQDKFSKYTKEEYTNHKSDLQTAFPTQTIPTYQEWLYRTGRIGICFSSNREAAEKANNLLAIWKRMNHDNSIPEDPELRKPIAQELLQQEPDAYLIAAGFCQAGPPSIWGDRAQPIYAAMHAIAVYFEAVPFKIQYGITPPPPTIEG